MSIFGPIAGNDLPLLHLSPAALKTLARGEQWEFEDQLVQHCIRVVWPESVRTGAPVRDLLNVAIGNAYALHADACDLNLTEENLAWFKEYARRTHEILTCLGFLIDEECRAIVRGTITPYPTAYSIFTASDLGPYANGQPISWALVWSLLNKLRLMRENYQRYVATDPLIRETVRIVGAVTGSDPRLTSCWRLDLYLREIGAQLSPEERAIVLGPSG